MSSHKPIHWRRNVLALTASISALLLVACGGGGGDDNGGGGGGGGGITSPITLDAAPTPGSISTTTAPPIYTFNVTSGVPYSVTLVSTSGDVDLLVTRGDPFTDPTATLIDASENFNNDIDAVSFIPTFSGTVHASVWPFLNSSYTIQATSNNLTVNAAARTASTYNNELLFSFDAQSGSGYEVRVVPTSGNVNIGAVSTSSTFFSSLGSSSNAGLATDSVTFVAGATQRHYIRVSHTTINTTFNISVHTVTLVPDLRVTLNSASTNGTNVTLSYTVQNAGAQSFTGTARVDGWANSATAPTMGSTGDAFNNHSTTLAPNGTLNGTLTIPNSNNSGTAYVVVDSAGTVSESDDTNNVSSGVAWEKATAPVTLNFENGLVPATLVMSGNLGWTIDSTTGGASSTRSLRSGAITHSQQSCVSITALSSSSITFDRRVSSESTFDFLRFYIDGVQQTAWSGALTAWTTSSTYAVTTGTHEFKWCYTKDIVVSSGSDAAWIDNISIQ